MKFASMLWTALVLSLVACTQSEYVVEAHYYFPDSPRPSSYEIVKTTSSKYAYAKYAETCLSYSEEFARAAQDSLSSDILRGDSVVVYLLKISGDIDTLKVKPIVLK